MARVYDRYLRQRISRRRLLQATGASALGAAGVSIHRMRQYGKGDPVPVVIETHDARRDAIDAAVDAIAALPVSMEPPVAIRIEEV